MTDLLAAAPAAPSPFWRFLRIAVLWDDPVWTGSVWRQLLRLATFGLYLYVAAALVLILVQDRLAFPGWAFRSDWAEPPAELGIVEVDLATADGNTVRAWWLAPPGWTPANGAVLYAHGNGQVVSDCAGHMRRWRDELKTAVLCFDFPGYGRSTGRPTEESCYAAAEAAHAWLTGVQKVPAGAVILLGESMGGALATHLAAEHGGRMLVLVGAYTSFPDVAQHQVWWLPSRYFARFGFDNEAKLRTLRVPVFTAHGMQDRVVPFSHGERNHAAAGGPKRFLPLADHPHMHPTRPAFYAALREFLDETRGG